MVEFFPFQVAMAQFAGYGAFLLAIGTVCVLLLWWIPKRQVRTVKLTTKERFDCENEARRTLAQILGGGFLLAGLFISSQTFRVTQEAQRSEGYATAVGQLGSVLPNGKKNLEVRIGAMYSLARLAAESREYHWPAVELLTAYIREHDQDRLDPRYPDSELQAALFIIGRRSSQWEKRGDRMNLAATKFRGADLRRANLRNAHLEYSIFPQAYVGYADFECADISEADFTHVYGLGTSQLNKACGDDGTKLPEKFPRNFRRVETCRDFCPFWR